MIKLFFGTIFSFQVYHLYGGRQGFFLAEGLRNFLQVYNLKGSEGEHPYTFTMDMGDRSPEEMYARYLRYNFYTVPLAFINSGSGIFGSRIDGGITRAFIGGPVQTFNFDSELRFRNVALPDHLFGGYVDVYFRSRPNGTGTEIVVVGGGMGTFPRINRFVGPKAFKTVMWFNRLME